MTFRKRNTVVRPTAHEIMVEEIDGDEWAINHERISFFTDTGINKSTRPILQPAADALRVMSSSVVGTRSPAENLIDSQTHFVE